jgi:hypothetical protein
MIGTIGKHQVLRLVTLSNGIVGHLLPERVDPVLG